MMRLKPLQTILPLHMDAMQKIELFAGYPPTVNHKQEANRASAIAADIVGAGKVHMNLPPSMAAEDFAYMLEARPGHISGWGQAKHTGKMLHNSHYDFNDEILPVGTSYWVKLVRIRNAALMAKQTSDSSKRLTFWAVLFGLASLAVISIASLFVWHKMGHVALGLQWLASS